MTLFKHWQVTLGILIVLLIISVPAKAVKFRLGDIRGSLSSQLSVGASWRLEDPDDDLVSPGNTNGEGNASASVTDDGNLNFEKGEMFSLIFKGRHDLSLSNEDDNIGAFLRFRYWYDYELEEGDREHGNSLNLYVADEPLDDSGFSDFASSSGIELLDAYIYSSFDLGERPVDIRLGRLVLSWGESTFIQNGVNVINPVDVSALRKPGSELKEALLPVGMIYLGAGLSDDFNMELFYQFEWKKTELDGCGNYFATNDVISDGCEILTGLSTPTDKDMAAGNYALAGLVNVEEPFVRRGEDIEPSDSGQYGLAFRYFTPAFNGAEFGLFYVNYHSRTPVFSGVKATTNNPIPEIAALLGADLVAPLIGNDPRYIAEYPEDIEVFALSFSTNVGSWAVSGELSHRPEMPIQINTTQIVHAIALGEVAPWSQMTETVNAAAPGGIIHGYDEYEFTQLQFTFLKFFDQVLGASRLSFVGEIGANFIGGLPGTEERSYGRSPTYGIGEFEPFQGPSLPATPANQGDTVTYSCEENPNALLASLPPNTIASNCTDEGYVTDSAWGYRFIAVLDYSDVFAGINLKPRIGWSHNVEGYSPPPNFNEDSKALTLALGAEYLNIYTANISYTNYSGGDYSTIKDRDFTALSFGVNF